MFSRAEILSEIMPYEMDDYYETHDEDVPDGWYENDLHLAAELGKTLLERNKELEANLLTAQQQSEELAMQIVYLEKQLNILRDVTESKAQIYEQLDYSSHELEKDNQKLKHDLKTSQQRLLRMTDSIENLETQVHDQQSVIDQLRKAEKDRLREGRRQQRFNDATIAGGWGGLPLRRAHSFDLGKPSVDSVYEDELSTLQLSVRNLKHQMALKEQKENELESEIAVLVRENQMREDHLQELQVKSKMQEIKKDYHSFDNVNEAVCKYCDSMISAEESEKAIARAKADELKRDDSPTKQQSNLELKPIAEDANPDTKCPLPCHDMIHAKSDGVSILGEIDAQYHNLMDKYNTLLTRSRSASFHESGSRSRTNSLRRKADSSLRASREKLATSPDNLDKASSADKLLSSSVAEDQEVSCPVDNHFETGPPEYKELFRKIYEVLHRPLKSHKKSSSSQ